MFACVVDASHCQPARPLLKPLCTACPRCSPLAGEARVQPHRQRLRDVVLVSYYPRQVKIAELPLDSYRMLLVSLQQACDAWCLGSCLQCWADACSAGQMPAVPGRCLQCRADACSAGQMPAVPGRCLQCRASCRGCTCCWPAAPPPTTTTTTTTTAEHCTTYALAMLRWPAGSCDGDHHYTAPAMYHHARHCPRAHTQAVLCRHWSGRPARPHPAPQPSHPSQQAAQHWQPHSAAPPSPLQTAASCRAAPPQ